MEWRAYWKPNITINLIADFTQYVSWKSLFFGALFFMYMLWFLAGHNFPSKLVTANLCKKSNTRGKRDCWINWPSFKWNYFYLKFCSKRDG